MIEQELQLLETEEHGTFTNNTVTGQTAEEVYAEWLVKKEVVPVDEKVATLNAKIAFIDSYKHQARLYFEYGNCGGKQRFANEDILFINLTIDGMKAGITPVKWKYSNGEYDTVTEVTYFETMKFTGGSLISKAFIVEEVVVNELKALETIEDLLAYNEKARFDELFSQA